MSFQHQRHSIIMSILGVVLVGLAGCGAPGPINATIKDYALQVNQTTTKSGKVSFKITNTGSVVHEFVIVQTDLAADKLPTNPDGSIDEEKLESPGEQGDLDVGKSADLTVDLKPGRYLLICNLPNHYKLGMHTEFTVTE
jgi:uncharacterized cupredoxin-like copper-binding protein